MSIYTWGVDGYGRAHICKVGEWEVVFSMIGYHGQIGVWLLEEQDERIENNTTINEVETCKSFDDAHSLMLALEDINSFEPENIKYKIIANKRVNN